MRGRTKILTALACVPLFALLLARVGTTDKAHLAYRLVREWLLDQDSSPLVAWVKDGHAPVLQVELRQSPPIEESTLRASKQAEYARCAAEWAAARSAAGQPTILDSRRGTLWLHVHVGTNGVHAELARPDGSAAVHEVLFAEPWSLGPACIASGAIVVLAFLLSWRRTPERPAATTTNA